MARATVRETIDELARDPLHNVVLLKQLLSFPDHVRVHRATGSRGTATLVALDVSASAYDRHAYPDARIAAFIASDHPDLTASLLSHLPDRTGIVFKLSRPDDLAAVERRFAVTRRTAFISFTSSCPVVPALVESEPVARVVSALDDATFDLLEAQGHERCWLEPRLRDGKAFACVLERDDGVASACFAFENFAPVWEVGGVLTVPSHRRRGHATRVVRRALAELADRGLTPRYQVEEGNLPSIRLAESVGLVPFVTIAHYAHAC